MTTKRKPVTKAVIKKEITKAKKVTKGKRVEKKLTPEEALNTIVGHTLDLIDKNPNDASLGKEIRNFYNSIVVKNK